MKTTTALITCLALGLLAGCATPPPPAKTQKQEDVPVINLDDPRALFRPPSAAVVQDRLNRTKVHGTLEIYHDHPRAGWLRGTIKNLGEKPVRYLRVRIDYLDTDKKVIHSDWDFAVDSLVLKPGEERQWSLLTRTPSGMKTYRVYPIL